MGQRSRYARNDGFSDTRAEIEEGFLASLGMTDAGKSAGAKASLMLLLNVGPKGPTPYACGTTKVVPSREMSSR